jgi:hypothetical protein
MLFLCFRKGTQEIFSELDETKAKPAHRKYSLKLVRSRRRRCREIGRIQELFPAPCCREESLPKAFSTTMVATGVMCE